MERYNLGPNGGILTALNLFTTKFDQVLGLVEKRADSVECVGSHGDTLYAELHLYGILPATLSSTRLGKSKYSLGPPQVQSSQMRLLPPFQRLLRTLLTRRAQWHPPHSCPTCCTPAGPSPVFYLSPHPHLFTSLSLCLIQYSIQDKAALHTRIQQNRRSLSRVCARMDARFRSVSDCACISSGLQRFRWRTDLHGQSDAQHELGFG